MTLCSWCKAPVSGGDAHPCCARNWPKAGRCRACDASRSQAQKWLRDSKECVGCSLRLDKRQFRGDRCPRCLRLEVVS